MWDPIPRAGIEPGPPALGHGVLATGPPGKSLYHFLEISELPTFFFKPGNLVLPGIQKDT